jgi:hypothetical protein
MYSEITALDVFFKITVFGLLLYKIFELFITYLLPLLKEQIFQDRKQQTEIFEKEKLFISTKQRIENQIYNQKQMFIHLERNVQAWHNNMLLERESLEQKNRINNERIQDKRRTQKKNMILFFDVQTSCPEALKRARKELMKEYLSENGKKEFFLMLSSLPQSCDILKN